MALPKAQPWSIDDKVLRFSSTHALVNAGLLAAMFFIISPAVCLKSFSVSNPGLSSLYLVWASVLRMDLAYGKQAEEFIV